MYKTTQVLVASLIVISIVLIMLAHVFSVLGVSVPAPPPEVEGVLHVNCTVAEVDESSFYFSYVAGFTSVLSLSAKNHYGFPVLIDMVQPLAVNGSKHRVLADIRIPPRGYGEGNVTVEWLGLPGYTALARPGDTLVFTQGGLEKIEDGLIAEYTSSQPVTPPPPGYTPPFPAPTEYTLNVSGQVISAEISDPGYAVRTLHSGLPGTGTLLALAEVEPEAYLYPETDVSYYLHVGGTGFYLRGDGTIGIIGGPSANTSTQHVYAALWLGEDKTQLYAGAARQAILETSPVALSPDTKIVYGVARIEKAERKIGLVMILWNHGGKRFEYEGAWNGRETNYLYFVVYLDSGRTEAKIWGPGATIGRLPFPETWIDMVYLPMDCNYGSRWPPFVWVMTVNPPGPDPCETGTCHADEFLDLVFGWDDTQARCIEEKFRITLYTDGWARIEHLKTGGEPYDEIFIAPIDDFVPGQDEDGDGFPDNWVHLWTLEDTPGSKVWKNVKDLLWYENTTIISKVYYQGLFKSKYLTITGLYPGDLVVLTTPHDVYTLKAENDTVTIDLLKAFGAQELIEALKRGGVRVTITPSYERVIPLLPTKALAHVKGGNVDTWVEVPVLARPKCTLRAGFRNTTGTLIVERAGEVYKVYVDTGNGTPSFLGVYAKIRVSATFDKIVIEYVDGSNITIFPFTQGQFGGAPLYFYKDIELLIGSDKVVLLEPVIPDKKPFKRLIIYGVFDAVLSITK